MAKASTYKGVNPVFQFRNKPEDCNELPKRVVKEARMKGELNLSKKGFAHVPSKVWQISMLDTDELNQLEMSFDAEGEKWWDPMPLTLLNLSENAIREIPGDVRNLDALTTLMLDGNCLDHLPTELGLLSKLTRLGLSRNRLRAVPPCVLCLTELCHLNLSHNQLEAVPDDIANLIMLSTLDVSANNLTTLNPSVGFLTRLTDLSVANNRLTDVPPDVGNLRALVRLDLSNNALRALPALGELRRLHELRLEHNALRQLPSVAGCAALRELSLADNNIQEMEGELLEGMTRLKGLDLEGNSIQAVPVEVTLLQHLCRLNLNNNNIKIVPACLGQLPHLTQLQVLDNPVENVRSDVLRCGTLRLLRQLRAADDPAAQPAARPVQQEWCEEDLHTLPDRYTMRESRSLCLASRNLSSVPDLVFQEAVHACVTTVDLAKNKLTELPPGLPLLSATVSELNVSCNVLVAVSPSVACFTHLLFLDLQRNCLETLPDELAALTSLRELNISYNKLVHLPDCVYSMTGVEILSASDNRLADIAADRLAGLARLTRLDLRNNNISTVPPELGLVTSIRTLELSGNSFRTPNHAALNKGTDFLMSLLRDRITK